MTTSADDNVRVSIQEHASHLMAVADAVHESQHQRKEKLEVLMNENKFDSDMNGSQLDDSMASLTTGIEENVSTTHSNANVATAVSPAEEVKDSESRTVASAGVDSKDKSSDKKKSRFQTVTELKQQVLDCNKALLNMQENADLKYRKLELVVINLKSNLETVKADLDCANMDKQKLEAEKQFLEASLQNVNGEHHANWLQRDTLKSTGSSNNVELSIDKVTRERDEVMAENKLMKEVMADCAQCTKKCLESKEEFHSGANHSHRTGLSLWNTLKNAALQGLTAEADATTPTSPPDVIRTLPPLPEIRQPPTEMFHFQEQSNQIKLDLEADIVAMEKKMQDDVEALKSEWSKPSPTSIVRGHRKSRQHGKKSRDRSTKESNNGSNTGSISSLDSFFASATQGLSLQSEEMDEERSLFSRSRSVASAPVGQGSRTKNDHNRKKSSSSTREADYRASYMSSGKSASFRQNFRASLLGLGDEVSTSSVSNRYNEGDHFDHLQRDVKDWGNMARRTTTGL